ncbi:hypothetical protein H5410_004263 [Solanum commersonii]|uniref:Uncharacterized protein n=1 Tax=Solanum commersonii TaxID=4109 RepID=A0A9J6B7H7_SOLCO|nr:hypothetical protein H5410_004263 [Solanum commersonii]
MKTHEKITKKRIEKIEKELEDMPNSGPRRSQHLCYVINKNLKPINDGIKENSRRKVLHQMLLNLIAGPMDSRGNSHGLGLFGPVDAPILSEIPLWFNSYRGTNFSAGA